MSELAAVQGLHDPTRAESAARSVRDGIFRAAYAPGEIIPLRPIAERAGCHLSALLTYLRRFEADGTMAVAHDVAIVPPLESDHLRSACRLNKFIFEHVIDDAMDRLTGADIVRMSTLQTADRPHEPPSLTAITARMFERVRIFGTRAYTTIEATTVRSGVHLTRRHLASPADLSLPDELVGSLVESELELDDRLLARRSDAVREAVISSIETTEAIGHVIVEHFADPEAEHELARVRRLRR